MEREREMGGVPDMQGTSNVVLEELDEVADESDMTTKGRNELVEVTKSDPIRTTEGRMEMVHATVEDVTRGRACNRIAEAVQQKVGEAETKGYDKRNISDKGKNIVIGGCHINDDDALGMWVLEDWVTYYKYKDVSESGDGKLQPFKEKEVDTGLVFKESARGEKVVYDLNRGVEENHVGLVLGKVGQRKRMWAETKDDGGMIRVYKKKKCRKTNLIRNALDDMAEENTDGVGVSKSRAGAAG